MSNLIENQTLKSADEREFNVYYSMRWVVIFLTFCFLSSNFPGVLLYAGDIAEKPAQGLRTVMDDGKQGVTKNPDSDQQPSQEYKKEEDGSGSKSGPSKISSEQEQNVVTGYPPSFIIPKGVCEKNEPVMVIGK